MPSCNKFSLQVNPRKRKRQNKSCKSFAEPLCTIKDYGGTDLGFRKGILIRAFPKSAANIFSSGIFKVKESCENLS